MCGWVRGPVWLVHTYCAYCAYCHGHYPDNCYCDDTCPIITLLLARHHPACYSNCRYPSPPEGRRAVSVRDVSPNTRTRVHAHLPHSRRTLHTTQVISIVFLPVTTISIVVEFAISISVRYTSIGTEPITGVYGRTTGIKQAEITGAPTYTAVIVAVRIN